MRTTLGQEEVLGAHTRRPARPEAGVGPLLLGADDGNDLGIDEDAVRRLLDLRLLVTQFGDEGAVGGTSVNAPYASACSSVRNSTGTKWNVASVDGRPAIFPKTPAEPPIGVLADHDRSHRDFLYANYSHPVPVTKHEDG
ncbi:hypothetical protein OG418_00185 [Streptomyces phaeochromogenes]|uniref:hypothetical protein n=1 Tax=Streptomyces phaeochromogenes TaxID=1923 RepID=UPI00324C9D0A